MTSVGMHHHATTGSRLSWAFGRRTFLATGVLSSILYGTVDLLAGLRYPGYSFYSQTISELGAIEAPKPAFLAPLFLTYSALMVVFAIAVLLEGVRANRRITWVGALLLAYMMAGSGTGFFPVHVRGTAAFADELPHIISGLAATAVMLVTIGVGSTAFDRRFRTFSWVMIVTMIVFGGLTVPFGFKLAAGEPTPGMGVTERIAYYAMLAWIATLSVRLMRRAGRAESGGSS